MRLLLCLTFALASLPAQAGLLMGLSLHWKSHALKPLLDEPTPNYYGYGPGLRLGYSLGQVIDIVGYTEYTPSQLSHAGLGEEDLQLYSYGGELGIRLGKVVFLGFRGGIMNYHMLFRKDETRELKGQWKGPGYGMTLGVISKVSKDTFFQLNFDVEGYTIERTDLVEEDARTLEAFGLSMTYIFNGFDKFLSGNMFIRNFMDSMSF